VAGGDITITVTVSDANGDVLTVTAVMQNASNAADVTNIVLSSTGVNTYQGVFPAPPNVTTTEVTYNVSIRADDGTTTTTANAGSITVQALQTPPVPPPPG